MGSAPLLGRPVWPSAAAVICGDICTALALCSLPPSHDGGCVLRWGCEHGNVGHYAAPPLRHHCYCGSNCAAPELRRQSPLLRRCLHCAWAACSARMSPPENRPQSIRRFHMLIHGKFVFASRPAESKTSRAISFSSHVRRPDAERPHGFCSREVKRQSPTLIEMPARNTQAQS